MDGIVYGIIGLVIYIAIIWVGVTVIRRTDR